MKPPPQSPSPFTPPPPPSLPPPPSRPPRRHQLMRTQWVKIQTLHFNTDWTYRAIATHYEITQQIIQWVCTHPQTSSKCSDQPFKLTDKQVNILMQFVTASKYNRQLTLWCLSSILEFDCSTWTVRSVLKCEKFEWYLVCQKSFIIKKNQQNQLAWTHEHKNWMMKQWFRILWTDETWVTREPHWWIWMTWRKNEKWNSICTTDKMQRKCDWMFWRFFSDVTKSSSLFWKKNWDNIDQISYQQHTVSLIKNYIK